MKWRNSAIPQASATRYPLSSFWPRIRKAQCRSQVRLRPVGKPPSPMGAVVAAAMDCPKVGGVIGAAAPLLDEVVSGVGAGAAAEMADALVADDHGGGKLTPGLGAIGTVQRIASFALGLLPTRRAMDHCLQRHNGFSRTNNAREACVPAGACVEIIAKI